MSTEQFPEYLALNAAASQLAQLDMRPNDTPRTAKDRWRKRITQALLDKKLLGTNAAIGTEDLYRWARTCKGLSQAFYANLPCSPCVTHMMAAERHSPGTFAGMRLTSFYAFEDLAEANKELNRLSVENADLRTAKDRLEREVAELRHKAERFEAICGKNQANASKTRGARKAK